MGRVINFLMGFIIGSLISAVIVFLVVPQGAQTIRKIYDEAYKARKAELEAQLLKLTPDI